MKVRKVKDRLEELGSYLLCLSPFAGEMNVYRIMKKYDKSRIPLIYSAGCVLAKLGFGALWLVPSTLSNFGGVMYFSTVGIEAIVLNSQYNNMLLVPNKENLPRL